MRLDFSYHSAGFTPVPSLISGASKKMADCVGRTAVDDAAGKDTILEFLVLRQTDDVAHSLGFQAFAYIGGGEGGIVTEIVAKPPVAIAGVNGPSITRQLSDFKRCRAVTHCAPGRRTG